MEKRPSRQAWLIPGIVAAILFVGGVASNLVASDLETTLNPYRRWVWLFFAIALIVAVATVIVEARRRTHSSVSKPPDSTDHSATAETTRIVNASAERSAAFGGDALHQLRAPVGDFVGRTKEIDTLINALRNGSRACITGISGMGGIGKTELALLVAERLKDDHPDAQFFINLQGTDANPRPPQEVLASCIRAFLGPEASLPEDLDQLLQLYRSQLNGKRVLLLLDNAADSAQVRPLLPPTGSWSLHGRLLLCRA